MYLTAPDARWRAFAFQSIFHAQENCMENCHSFSNCKIRIAREEADNSALYCKNEPLQRKSDAENRRRREKLHLLNFSPFCYFLLLLLLRVVYTFYEYKEGRVFAFQSSVLSKKIVTLWLVSLDHRFFVSPDNIRIQS